MNNTHIKLLLYATIIVLVLAMIAMFVYTQEVMQLKMAIKEEGCRALCERCFNMTHFGDFRVPVNHSTSV